MPEFFISPKGHIVKDWQLAFENVHGVASLADLPRGFHDERKVIWLHAPALSQDWVKSQILALLQLNQNHRLVVLADIPSQQEAFRVMSVGAAGYCHAYSAPDMLKEVREVVLHGGIWLGQDLLQQLIAVSTNLVSASSPQIESMLNQLTQREREVAQAVAKGLSNKEIARVLDITERTVKAHISACFERLGIKDRLQLALMFNEKSTQNPH